MFFKKIRSNLFLLLSFFLISACEQQTSTTTYPLHYSDAIMGTSFTIKASKIPDTIKQDELKEKLKTLLDSINGQMSTYQEDSELSLLNKDQSNQWQKVSTPLYSVLEQAKIISELSGGAFDISVGSLVNLWGFGSDAMSFKAPDEKLLTQQLQKTGYQHLVLDDSTQQVKKLIPELYLDLSAIAKGYAVDQVGKMLEKHAIFDYMVEIGGELRLKGLNNQSKPWRIAVEKPDANQRMIQKVLSLTDVGLATSGDYRNFFEQDGVRFSHTIDPRTGKPITHKLASVTILSDTTMKADGLATALMVLGPKHGLELAEKEHIAALFIIKSGDGFIEQASSSFANKVEK